VADESSFEISLPHGVGRGYSLTGRKQHLADLLFEKGAIQFGSFRLKHHENRPDAPLSPIFLNLRTPANAKPGPLDPESVSELAAGLRELIESSPALGFTTLAGIPNAGEPLATALAALYAAPIPVARLSKEETGGTRRVWAGASPDPLLNPASKVLLVDDLITQAATKLEAIAAVESTGASVQGLILVVDREQGGAEQLRQAGYPVHAALTLSELLDHYVATGRIASSKADQVIGYIRAETLAK
jgi:orotate phosphoribosyltransferase